MIVRIVLRARRSSSVESRFVHPMSPTPRTAILAPGFQQTKLVRVFAAGWCEEAARFQPTSIAGTVEQLRGLTRISGISLSHAVVVFTSQGEAGLSSSDRDLFWKSFGVPVFEQRLGPRNELIAMECEAHAGLHMVGDFSHLRRDKNTCACGNPAPRLPGPARRPRPAQPVDLVRRPKTEQAAALSA